MRTYIYRALLIVILSCSSLSCKKYLDIVPDNIATIEYAFRMRSIAERYLFTCYSFLPEDGSLLYGPAMLGGDELWLTTYPYKEFDAAAFDIARGNQNVNTPLISYWSGTGHDKSLWRGIRECNIFIENIINVPDMDDDERQKWLAEAKFLKAYYHFYLLRMYGPIPIMETNVATDASLDQVRVSRRPVDEVFDFIVKSLDEAIPHLPDDVIDRVADLGRITKPIAMGMKAKILVYAASPLFNGNSDYAGFKNKDGTVLFNQTYSVDKWTKAAAACKEAIDLAHSLGYALHRFEPTQQTATISDQTRVQLDIRTTLTERWNKETIWADAKYSSFLLQAHATPKWDKTSNAISNSTPRGSLSVPAKIAYQFYTKNGVPIDEDITWDYNGRYGVDIGTASNKNLIKTGFTAIKFNFDRETRFYASLGFDAGIWYGQGRYDENSTTLPLFFLDGKVGRTNGGLGGPTASGFNAKKLVHYTNVIAAASTGYTVRDYPWILLRLADLYLLYAEAQNESAGPGPEVYKYLDMIRERAALPGVLTAWDNFSNTPGKPRQQEGLRKIIQQERGIELCFEAQRFWDMRRWKRAIDVYNQPITMWEYYDETGQGYFRERVLFNQEFSFKDYFWPIKESDIIINNNLVQNPGW
jgi:hypothetical protein